MRRLLPASVLIAALALPAAVPAAAPPLQAVLKTPASASTKARWPWTVTATVAGKPAAGRVTVQIVDPLGTVHAVDYDGRPKVWITRIPFRGRFGDVVTWPASARGFPLTFRVIIEAAGQKRVLDRVVSVR